MTRRIDALSEIVGNFDAILVDQYGVLHDGQTAFPGALQALEGLHRLGLPVVAVTNSGKRAAANLKRLGRLGFPAKLFTQVVSSGEVVWRMLRDGLAAGTLRGGDRVLLLARDDDASLLDGLDLVRARPGAPADLVLIAGAEPERLSRDDYRALLAPFARAGVPALCANPDRVMYAGSGSAFGPGVVAEDYASAGGHVDYSGKPSSAFFRAALAAAGNPDPARTLMIGDSPHHDISGAAALGMVTLLVEGGVQAGLESDGAVATYATEKLKWRHD